MSLENTDAATLRLIRKGGAIAKDRGASFAAISDGETP
jgi:hypothetical protein